MSFSLIYYIGDDPKEFYVLEGTQTSLRLTGSLLMSGARSVTKCDLIRDGRRIETCNARGHWTAVHEGVAG